MDRKMKEKPPGLAPRYGAQFKDPSIVRAYRTRPPYPEALLARVLAIAEVERPRVLDLGCGTGEVARRLAPHASHVTAVDHSLPMIETARGLPGGAAPNLEWIASPVEHVALDDPYDLALAAESFHWFDWERLCPRLARLVPSARLVMIDARADRGSPWLDDLFALIVRYSTNRDFEPYDLVALLVERRCFELEAEEELESPPFRQSIDDYVTCLHSRNGFSLDRMEPAAAEEFDAHVRSLLSPHTVGGHLELGIVVQLISGRVRA